MPTRVEVEVPLAPPEEEGEDGPLVQGYGEAEGPLLMRGGLLGQAEDAVCVTMHPGDPETAFKVRDRDRAMKHHAREMNKQDSCVVVFLSPPEQRYPVNRCRLPPHHGRTPQ